MNVAVVDIGTARLKVLIAFPQARRGTEFESVSLDLPQIGESDQWRAEASKAFDQAKAYIAQHGVTMVLAYGTQALRDAGRGSVAHTLAEEAFGHVALLAPESEARSFHQSVLEVLGRSEGVASCDVGGGSVQIVWGRAADAWGSAPIGTFALERQFQESAARPSRPGDDRFTSMESHVVAELSSLLNGQVASRQTLVVGSNIMSDFFTSALGAIGLAPTVEAAGVGFGRGDLDRLCEAVFGQDFDTLHYLFPANPRFLHGADKLLMVARSAANLFGASAIIATNLSVSKGLAVLALENPAELGGLGF